MSSSHKYSLTTAEEVLLLDLKDSIKRAFVEPWQNNNTLNYTMNDYILLCSFISTWCLYRSFTKTIKASMRQAGVNVDGVVDPTRQSLYITLTVQNIPYTTILGLRNNP